MKKIAKILLIIYSISLLVFLFIEFSPLEFTDIRVKKIFYNYSIFGMPFLGLFFIKNRLWCLVTGVGLAIIGGIVLNSIVFSFGFWHSNSTWETKEIIAVHKTKKRTFIAEQWIDSGALGYAKGIFKITPITPFLCWKINYYGKTLDNNWEIKSHRKLEIGS